MAGILFYEPESDIGELPVPGSGLFLFSLSQKISSDCIENRSVCFLFRGKTGEIVGCMSFWIIQRYGNSFRRCIASLQELAGVEKRQSGSLNQLAESIETVLNQQLILWFLTDIQREVYRLVKIVGHTQTEAANILGTSIPNINKHLKKAMDRIEAEKEKM